MWLISLIFADYICGTQSANIKICKNLLGSREIFWFIFINCTIQRTNITFLASLQVRLKDKTHLLFSCVCDYHGGAAPSPCTNILY